MLRTLLYLTMASIACIIILVAANSPVMPDYGSSLSSWRFAGELIGSTLTLLTVSALAAGAMRLASGPNSDAPFLFGLFVLVLFTAAVFIGGNV